MAYQQPDYRIPITDPRVSVVTEGINNPLSLSWPLPVFIEKLSDKDDPSHNVRNGRSGRGGPG